MNRVLYAEDEFTNRKLMEIMLTQQGIDCTIVENGNDAITAYEKANYDLIILDQYMPGCNGNTVAQYIRKKDRKIPIIAITSDDNDIENLKQYGFNSVFIKPMRGKNYIEIIKKYLKGDSETH